jgi:NADH-quinone oxidoreductase subunit M
VYILIGIWGGANRAYAAMKFLIYTLLGSAFMLVGILYLYYSVGQSTFEMSVLADQARNLNFGFQSTIFILLFIAFAVKLPLVPIHTWLPNAYGEASTPVTFILAGIVSKLGAYAILRISWSLLPEVAHAFAPYLAIFAVINIIYGGMIAIVQTDLKRVVAYSSVSHMGYIMLGATALNEIGLSGAIFQMVAHALITALLFAAVGIVKDRTDTIVIPKPGEEIQPTSLQGIANSMPILATIMMIAGLASLGLPLLAGFNAEFLIFLGSFQANAVTAIIGVFGVVLSAGYVLFTYRRVFFGEATDRTRNLQDVTVIEAVPLFTLVTAIVALGVFPWLVMPLIQTGVAPILSQLAGR